MEEIERKKEMKEKLQNIREEALKAIQSADVPEKLNDVRVKFLGKKGELTAVLKSMKDVAAEDRPKIGQMVNDARAEIEAALEESKKKMDRAIREEKMKREVIDVTLPAKKNLVGHSHPNTIALEEVERIFVGMGYEVVEGPEVEYDLYNFEKLNIPDGHPAKDEQDTFYVNKDIVLRTQTSSVHCAADPDLLCTGPDHGTDQAAHPRDLPGTGVPFRRSGRHPFSFLPSDRRSGSGQEHLLRGPEGNPGSLCQGTVRTGYKDQVPSSSFPVHRAKRGGGCKLLQVRRERLPVL